MEEQRQNVRTELKRWHPDKFHADFGQRLVAADRKRIMDRVHEISCLLNDLK